MSKLRMAKSLLGNLRSVCLVMFIYFLKKLPLVRMIIRTTVKLSSMKKTFHIRRGNIYKDYLNLQYTNVKIKLMTVSLA